MRAQQWYALRMQKLSSCSQPSEVILYLHNKIDHSVSATRRGDVRAGKKEEGRQPRLMVQWSSSRCVSADATNDVRESVT